MDCGQSIAVLRHGLTEHNRQDRYQGSLDTSLCSDGVEQIRLALPSLIQLGIGRVISSPLLRAVQSAEIIAEALRCEASVMSDFTERSMGVLEGLRRIEAKLHFPSLHRREVMHDFSWAPPNGESLTEVTIRVHRGLLRILKSHSESSVLVTHGTVAKVIHWLFGRSDDTTFFEYSLSNGAFELYHLDEYRSQRI